MSVKMCGAVHPAYPESKCWKRRHDDDERHMTVLSADNGQVRKTYWGDAHA